MTEHKFPYKWNLKDGYPAKNIESNNLNVFGTFICGGGSTMGYKLAGFNHLGGVEIDPKVAAVYKINHNPKYLYIQDIREFVKRDDIPDELYNLDILDGSPPCSSFSMAGNREKDWGKEKVFREGQALQVLDDLFFDYIELAKKLQPKVIIAENVKGLIQGNSKAYLYQINKKLKETGYKIQLFLLNSSSMGIPQQRERVFFICSRNDLKLPDLKLSFNESPIFSKDLSNRLINKKILTATNERHILHGRLPIHDGNKTTPFTLTATGNSIDFCDDLILKDRFINPSKYSDYELSLIGSYPLDYNFNTLKAQYLIGMSVPPVMTAQIAHQIYLQWFNEST